MPYIDRRKQVIRLKIVYYGPGLSGKTTNLSSLYATFPENRRGELLQLDTETERTLFFDYFPAALGDLGSWNVRVDFFTVPGQSFYGATRRAVLDGADGVVFVADSSARREEANLVALEEMLATLRAQGREPGDVPLVFQWNKRDSQDALPEALLERTLNRGKHPSFPAIASEGVGIWDCQREVLRLALDTLRVRSPEARLHA